MTMPPDTPTTIEHTGTVRFRFDGDKLFAGDIFFGAIVLHPTGRFFVWQRVYDLRVALGFSPTREAAQSALIEAAIGKLFGEKG